MKTRVAIFVKGDHTSLVGLNTSRSRNFLGHAGARRRPSAKTPGVSMCDDPRAAETAFAHCLRMSLERGWAIVYYGPVLRG